MAESAGHWIRRLRGRARTDNNPSDPFGAASYYVDQQMQARRCSPEWSELREPSVTPPNLPRSAGFDAANRHLSRPGRWTA